VRCTVHSTKMSCAPSIYLARDEPDDTEAGVLDLSVVQLRVEAERVISIELADPFGGMLPSWTPGAHIDLLLGDVVRQYSLCGDPADRFIYRVAVLREELSRGGSAYVHDALRPGQFLEVGGPRNHFELGAHDEYLFLAGGIGITPILPMITEVSHRGAPWRLSYGGRTRSSMAFCRDLQMYGDQVEVLPEDEHGLLDLATILARPRPGVGIYVCGPEGLLQAVETGCATWPKDALHVERFQASPRPDFEIDTEFVAECRRSDCEVTVSAGESLLDALERAGIRLPNACRDGVCGSCEIAVLAGPVEHRDSVLSDREREKNDRMMACVSRAARLRITVDV
jgi:ferredoxin-NADP reductase